jgi:hypothetical protein
MSEMGDMWKGVRAERQAQNRARLEATEPMLRAAGLAWSTKNDGEHLIILTKAARRVDLWPSTGLWITWDMRRGHGVEQLINTLNKEHQL